MGNICCSGLSDAEQAAKRACKEVNLEALKKAFSESSPTSNPIDVFKIIDESEFKLDLFSLLMYSIMKEVWDSRSKPATILPFLQLFKDQIEKNNNNSNQTSVSTPFTPPQVDKLGATYAELAVQLYPADLESFKFVLDNFNIFPFILRTEHSRPILLHELSSKPESLPLLQEYISRSGPVSLEVFKNKNSNNSTDDNETRNNKKMWNFDDQTPLQVACANFNAPAVQALCAANQGGNNYVDCIRTMIIDNMIVGTGLLDEDEVRAAEPDAAQIFQTIMNALPNKDSSAAAVTIRDIEYEISASDYRIDEYAEFCGVTRADLLGITSSSNSSNVVVVSLSVAVLYLCRFDDLFQVMLSNGCKPVRRGKNNAFSSPLVFSPSSADDNDNGSNKIPSEGFFKCCVDASSDDVDKIETLLVKHRVQDWLIDVDATFMYNQQQMTPLQAVNKKLEEHENSNNENLKKVRDMLITEARYRNFSKKAKELNE